MTDQAAVAQRMAEYWAKIRKPDPEAEARRRRMECIKTLLADLPTRFRWTWIANESDHPKVENYQIKYPAQKPVVTTLLALQRGLAEHITDGRGLILWGPVGTGKDHLLTGVVKVAAHLGLSARYRNTAGLFGEIAAAALAEDSSPDAVIRRYTKPSVLCLSDMDIGWKETHQNNLRWLVTARNDEYRSTWITLNTNLEILAKRLGPPLWDRLRSKAVILECNWPSWR
jgi:DNA replication protein DnaC